MTLHIETKLRDRVRVIDTDSPFYRWEGMIDQMPGDGLYIGHFIDHPLNQSPISLTFKSNQLENVHYMDQWKYLK